MRGIELYAHGGITADEQRVGQRYRVHVEMQLDLGAAAASDDVRQTVSYADVHDTVIVTLRESPFSLLEAAASRVIDRLRDEYAVQHVTVEVQKLLPPIDGVVEYAAVRLSR